MPSAPKGVIPERQFDIIVECSGNALSTAASFALAREEVIMFGFCRNLIPLFQHVWFETELTIKNSRQLSNSDLKQVADLASQGSIDPAQLVTHRFSFSEYSKAIDAVGGHEEIFSEMVKMFIGDYHQRIEDLKDSIKEEDGDKVRSCAHGIKGNLAQVMAYRATELAAEIEEMGLEARIGEAEKILPDFEKEIERVGEVLKEFLDNNQDQETRN